MSIEAMKLALEALEDAQYFIEAELNDRMDLYKNYPNLAHKYAGEQKSLRENQEAITALRQAIEQAQKQEPVVFKPPFPSSAGELMPKTLVYTAKQVERMLVQDIEAPLTLNGVPLYTSPPQRQPFNHHEFGYWWFEYGSGLHPLEGEDQEQHAYRVATEAWKAAHGIKGEA